MEEGTPQPEHVSTRPGPTRISFEQHGSHVASPLRDTSFNPPRHATAPTPTVSHKDNARLELNASSSMDSEDESQMETRRPVGRAARRMLGGDKSLTASPDHDTTPPDGSLPDSVSDDELYTATPQKALTTGVGPPSIPMSQAHSTRFVSQAEITPHDSDSDLEISKKTHGFQSKLAALVAEKRAERLAREAKEDADHSSDLPDEIVEGSHEPFDPEVERILSDAARPTRKASTKARIEVTRETQRMDRQKALTHQMRTRRKFTTNDLFTKFNYHPAGPQATEGETSASSAPNSDAVESLAREPVSTPPSSPPTPLDRQKALVEQGALSKVISVREDSLASLAGMDDDGDHLEMAEIHRSSRDRKVMKNKGAVLDPPAPVNVSKRALELARRGKTAIAAPQQDGSSDDDLEIIVELPDRLSVFEKAKGTMKRQHADSAAIHRLKHLAQIGADNSRTSGPRNGRVRSSITPQALEIQLRMRAKEQARAQQLERIAELKAKGIDVQTVEEREREQVAFENFLEKARQDAIEVRKAEKALAKAGDGGVASDDESEDNDYTDGSGSEDEWREESGREGSGMVDEVADDSDDDEEDEEEEVEDKQEPALTVEADQENSVLDESAVDGIEKLPATSTSLHTPAVGRKPRTVRIVLDDEDESDTEASQVVPQPDATPDDDPFAAFKFNAANQAGSLMSPTQMFNATMQTPTQATQQDSMDVSNFLVPPTSSSLPPVSLDMTIHTQNDCQLSAVPRSQPESQPINLAWATQAPATPLLGMNRGASSLILDTPVWEPTQDAGLPETPSLRREATAGSVPEHEIQTTIRLRISESPAASMPKRSRLVSGQRPVMNDSDNDDDDDYDNERFAASTTPSRKDVFREMARKRKEALSAAELAEAERAAKQMMDEQAEESEDEYAGLGGDDYVAPETEQDRAMIDASHIDVNEHELAAHFAERERVADEAQTNKIYMDLMTGALRRKQANIFDLDEDEDDLAVRRRQMRQREEARKRKLLLQDHNIAGLAEGKQSKGKDAFLKAIADNDDRDDIFDLSDMEADDDAQESMSGSQPSQRPEDATIPLPEVSGNKRRMEEAPGNRLPAKQRRTQASAFRAPTSLFEVKESVSFLLDEPDTQAVGLTTLDASSDCGQGDDEPEQTDGDDEEAVQEELRRENEGGYAADRIAMPPPRLPASQRRTLHVAKRSVVDRLSLKRTSSAADNAQGRTAWAASANAGSKFPSLLRRATTNSSVHGSNERGVSTSASLPREDSGSGVKTGGSKKSSLAYQARDSERRAIVEASAKRRAENTARKAQLRRNASGGIGRGMSGRFE